MFAFFFNFDDLGILNDNYIVREAFEQCLFSKLILEGYTDINPLIGKPRITKSEMENKLRKINSPLARLYAGAFPKSNNDIEENMLPVLNELEQLKKDGRYDVDDFSYFSIVYYIFQRYKSMSEKLNFIIKIYEEWNKEETDYNIKISNGIVYDALNVDVNFVSSVTDYVKFIREFKNNDNKIFFRGHSNVSYDLQPSLFRKKNG